MIHTLLQRLDVTVKHAGIRFNAEFVGRTGHLEPLVSRGLVRAKLTADPIREDFSTTASNGLQTALIPQPNQHFFNGQARNLSKMRNLNASKPFDI